MLVALYKEKELLRLSAGKIYCNRGFYDITCGFYPYIFQGGAVGGGRQGKLLFYCSLVISLSRPILTEFIDDNIIIFTNNQSSIAVCSY